MGHERNRPGRADGGGIFGIHHRCAGPTAKKARRFGGAGRTASATRSARGRACRTASTTRSARDRTAVVPVAPAQRVAACNAAAHCDAAHAAPTRRVAAYSAPA
jgi:hypothetical protein